MIPNLTALSENNNQSAQRDKKKGLQNEQFVIDMAMHYQAFVI